MKKQIIPIFFSVDDYYLPFLSVALKSLEEHASRDYEYNIRIIHTKTVSEENQKNIVEEFNFDVFHVSFVDISDYVKEIDKKLHTRDYYTKSTYYRLFIPSIFKDLDKALYLDSDILVLGDISKLYNHELGNNLVGAIVEDVMLNFDVFGTYVEKTLGISRNNYFNAGILLMNTKLFREEKVEDQFFDLLFKFTFYVVQDEDYLNVLCKDRVTLIDKSWNKTPIPGTIVPHTELNLIHYKINWKPWKYDDVAYGDLFWAYAYNTRYFLTMVDIIRKNSTPEAKAKDAEEFRTLAERAVLDSNDPNNYYQTQLKLKKGE